MHSFYRSPIWLSGGSGVGGVSSGWGSMPSLCSGSCASSIVSAGVPASSSASRSCAVVSSTSVAPPLIASMRESISCARASTLFVVLITSRRSVNAATSVTVPSNWSALSLCAGGSSSLMACLVSSVTTSALK